MRGMGFGRSRVRGLGSGTLLHHRSLTEVLVAPPPLRPQFVGTVNRELADAKAL